MMVMPLVGAALRAGAKKLAEKGGKQVTKKKPMETDELMRNVAGTSMGVSGAAGATAMALGQDDKRKAAGEKKEQESRESAAEMKRETRGMKKGGTVSASKRADGIAVKGKTKGRFV